MFYCVNSENKVPMECGCVLGVLMCEIEEVGHFFPLLVMIT